VAGDGTGNHYITVTEASSEPTGVIFFIDTVPLEDRPTYAVGSDMWHFLRGVLSTEIGEDWWLYDGIRTLEADTRLAQFSEYGLPWKM
jgi:hypothetical protein